MREWPSWPQGLAFLANAPRLFVESVRTMLAAALAAIATLEVVFLRKNDETFLRVVIVFAFYFAFSVTHLCAYTCEL